MNFFFLSSVGGVVVAASGLLFEWISWIQYVMLLYLIFIGWLAPVPTGGYGAAGLSLLVAVAVVFFNLIGAINPVDVLMRFVALYLGYFSIVRMVAAGGGKYFLLWVMIAVAGFSSVAALNLEEWEGTGRLSWAGIHPNLLAMYGYVLGIGLVTLPKTRQKRILGMFVAIGFILLFSSRAPFVALVVFCLLFFLLSVNAAKGTIIIGLSSVLVLNLASEWVGSVLMLNDDYRGVDSGFSGRIDYWRSALQLFSENPIVGVGYGQAEKLLGIPIDNGYMLLLAEGGVIGALAFFFLVANFFRLAINQQGDEFGKIALSLLVSFCVYIIFERRYLAIGNPLSILMMITYAGLVLRSKILTG